MRHRQEDPHTDEVLTLAGDQLFGDLRAMTSQTITLEAPYGRVSLHWPQVRSVRLRRQPMRLQTASGVLMKRGDWPYRHDSRKSSIIRMTIVLF